MNWWSNGQPNTSLDGFLLPPINQTSMITPDYDFLILLQQLWAPLFTSSWRGVYLDYIYIYILFLLAQPLDLQVLGTRIPPFRSSNWLIQSTIQCYGKLSGSTIAIVSLQWSNREVINSHGWVRVEILEATSCEGPAFHRERPSWAA